MNSNPKRTYLFTLVDSGGTVPPELAVARKLIERGHTVIALAEDSMEPEVRASGATFRPWEHAPNRASRQAHDDPYRDWEAKNPKQLIERLLDKALATPAPLYAADVRAAIEAVAPDTVVCSEFAIGAMVGAESSGIPFDVLMPNIYLCPVPGLPPFGLGLKPAKSVLGRGRDRALNSLIARMWDKGLARINALRSEYGLAPIAHFWDQIHHARRELVLTSAAFDFPARLPANVRYVGAQLDDPAWAEACALPGGDGPLVLVAMSSTFQDHADSLQRVADGLGRLPVGALLTTGPAIDPEVVRAPANVTVVRSAPHSQAMQQAAVVVTHGGHGTVVKSLAAGAPLVVMPHGRDQADNATRVSMRGAGVTVKRGASPEQIANAVQAVIDAPGYRQRAGALGTTIRRDAATSRVVDELEAHPDRDAQAAGAR
jgi:MGT family glycosyltransferase